MRDKSHVDHIEKWARYVREHPRSEWIKEVKPLVDGQIIMANRFYERLAKEKGGKEKIAKIRSRDSRPEYVSKAEDTLEEKAIRVGSVAELRKRYGK